MQNVTSQMTNEKCHVTESQNNVETMNEIHTVLRLRVQRDEPAPCEDVLQRVLMNKKFMYMVTFGHCLAPNAEWHPIIELDMF